LAATLFGSVLASVWAAWVAATSNSASGIFFAVVIIATGVGLPLWLLASTSYRIEGAILIISCGPFRWNIPLSEIHRISSSRSVTSGPALSLSRLRIEYGRGQVVLVSPRDPEAFLQAVGK
jgi:hypothetical protein